MIALRILGGLAAVAFLSVAMVRYRRRQISRLSLIISSVITIGVLLLAIVPNLFNPIFDLLHFRPGSGRRLTALLLVAVAVLFALVIRLQSYVDVNERNIRLLVEAFGRERFDWEAAATLPPGKGIVVISPAHNEATDTTSCPSSSTTARRTERPTRRDGPGPSWPASRSGGAGAWPSGWGTRSR